MPLHWSPLTTFSTTLRDSRSPVVHLEAGVLVIEVTAHLRPGRAAPHLMLHLDHARVGLESHIVHIQDFTAPPGEPLIGRRAFRIVHPGPYAIGVHTDAITRVTVRLLRA